MEDMVNTLELTYPFKGDYIPGIFNYANSTLVTLNITANAAGVRFGKVTANRTAGFQLGIPNSVCQGICFSVGKLST